jgi:hypothetical protein
MGGALTGLAQNRPADPTAVTEQKALAAFKGRSVATGRPDAVEQA